MRIRGIERTKLDRALRTLNCGLRLTHPRKDKCTVTKCDDIRVAHHQRTIKEFESSSDIMIVEPDDYRRNRKRRGIFRARGRRGAGMLNRPSAVFRAESASREAKVTPLPDHTPRSPLPRLT